MFLDPNRHIEKHPSHLPHWHQDDTAVFLTWRLADSLPEKVVQKINGQKSDWLACHPRPWDQKKSAEHQRRFILPLENFLDDCHGSCCLRQPETRQIVADAFHHFDSERYELDCFVVMPNHVHVLIQLKETHPLEDVIHSIKSFTAKQINRALNRRAPLWQERYWDRLIRSQKHLDWTRQYIQKNPEKLRPTDFTLWQKPEARE